MSLKVDTLNRTIVFDLKLILRLTGTFKKLGEKAYLLQNPQKEVSTANDSDEEENFVNTEKENLHMSKLEYKYESSVYSSDSEESVSDRLSPPPDDENSE